MICAAAFFPVGKLADLSNGGTLAAFFSVAMGVMILRRTAKDASGRFRTPVDLAGGPAGADRLRGAFLLLPLFTKLVFFGWAVLGLIVYACYGYHRSALAEDARAALARPKPIVGPQS